MGFVNSGQYFIFRLLRFIHKDFLGLYSKVLFIQSQFLLMRLRLTLSDLFFIVIDSFFSR